MIEQQPRHAEREADAAPPGPPTLHSFRTDQAGEAAQARIIHYRSGNPGVFLWVYDRLPQEDGSDFWDAQNGNRPHILRLLDLDGLPRPDAPLLYVVRPGHERLDALALDALLEQQGPRLDAKALHIDAGFIVQLVAIVQKIGAVEGSKSNG